MRNSVGKMTPTAIYVHRRATERMPVLLKLYEHCGAVAVGRPVDWDLIKLSHEGSVQQPYPPGALMSFHLVMPPDVTPAGGEDAALGLLARAGMVAVRAADLASPFGRGLGKDGRTALTAAGPARIRAGDLVVWLKPVAVTPAVVRRDGRIQAAGHPADHARLGVAEQRLDELTGRPGVIDEIAQAVALAGKVKGTARWAMSPALAIRFTLLMTLAPDADYPEVMDILFGDLVLVPWQRSYRVPTAAAACTWRDAIGPTPLERLQDLLLDGIDDEHRSRDYRAVMVGDLDVGSIDGSLIRVPDSAANRTAFWSAGTADDSSPYPQVRELRLSNASTRAAFAVTTGPSGAGADRDKGEAEHVSVVADVILHGRVARCRCSSRHRANRRLRSCRPVACGSTNAYSAACCATALP
jgi:hypothetical protein